MKHILVIATGGTIASMPFAHGLTPALSGKDLMEYVPQLKDICTFDVVQLMNIDSTNMQPQNWQEIARAIEVHYAQYDAFVILHGTDTMAYTAAALSYLVQDSPKPIVLTGSQQPMTSAFTDAKLNLYQAVLFALDDTSCDVSVVFGGSALCGTRAYKQKTMSFNAFTSINYPPCAYIRNNKIIRHDVRGHILSEGSKGTTADKQNDSSTGQKPCITCSCAPKFYHNLSDRVMCLRLTPGLKPSIFKALSSDYDAIILETFGIGGIPNSESWSFVEALTHWIESGKTLVLTTQVIEEGLDLGVYEVGHRFADHPSVLRGDDMTTEALLAKTMWVLGEANSLAEIRELFYKPINHDRTVV